MTEFAMAHPFITASVVVFGLIVIDAAITNFTNMRIQSAHYKAQIKAMELELHEMFNDVAEDDE